MKADLAMFGGAAACLLLIPLAVLAWSKTPVGESSSLLSPAPAAPIILPGDSDPEPSGDAEEPSPAENAAEEEVIMEFKILDESTGEVRSVAVLDYVTGAIASEMPASYDEDALIAQGIASCTDGFYLARLRRANPEEALKGADFSADPQNMAGYLTEQQMRECWGDSYQFYYDRVHTAAETAVKYRLTYEGEPILAAYFAISAGKTTEDSGNVWSTSLSYLTPVDSSWDKEAPGYESTVTLSNAELHDLLAGAGAVLGSDHTKWLEILSRSDAGYVTSIQAGSLTLTGQEFRTLLELRSSCFDWAWEKGSITFSVQGYGHGVGLSQNGANYLAQQGRNFAEILAHYYPGAELTTANADFYLD